MVIFPRILLHSSASGVSEVSGKASMSPHLPPITHPYVSDTSGFLSDISDFRSRVVRDTLDGERETTFLIGCFKVKF